MPGFSTIGDFSAKIQIAPKTPIIQSPSQNQNYVIQNKIRVAGVTMASQITGLSADELQQTITYYDGLGRAMQNVQTQANPDLQDIVTPIVYDPFGRVDKSYLPYASIGTGDGSYKVNAITEISSFYNPVGGTDLQLLGAIPRIPTPFAKTVFEPSPLNRIMEQGFPRNMWQPASTRTSG
ncbi:DUF6443 domain-containing protein [Pedobacter gandavensis]|uniref:DUF6443 domain-containing protein n=1 Tax=Pedobacter gandavensis TaxID=2679963 RepID=UPI00292F9ED3|nr:DUF6443 domain-containing protein [Pedobacter gandavensis]